MPCSHGILDLDLDLNLVRSHVKRPPHLSDPPRLFVTAHENSNLNLSLPDLASYQRHVRILNACSYTHEVRFFNSFNPVRLTMDSYTKG